MAATGRRVNAADLIDGRKPQGSTMSYMKHFAVCLLYSSLIFCGVARAQTPVSIQAPGQAFRHCADCPEMIVIPGGSLVQADPNAKVDRGHRKVPQKSIGVRSFALGRTEVTQGQWKAVMGSNPSKFDRCGDDCPVERISWMDVEEFIRRLNRKTGQAYRLPSDVEWEYACHAGSTNTYCGGEKIDSVAWYESNSGKKTHSVASKQPNAWGLYDMTGNVWEWTQDCHDKNPTGASGDRGAPAEHDCQRHALRGGSWGSMQRLVNTAYRGAYPAKSRAYAVVSRRSDFGLRLAASLP